MSLTRAGEERPVTDYPAWAREIRSLIRVAGLFVVSGNVRDVYLSPAGRVLDLPGLLREMLAGVGYSEVGVILAGGSFEGSAEEVWARATSSVGGAPEVPLDLIGDVVHGLATSEVGPRALLVMDASRVVTRAGDLTDDEAALFRQVRRAVDDSSPGANGCLPPVVWVVDAVHDVPTWLVGGNPRGRVVSVPLPTSSERDLLAGRLLRGLNASVDATLASRARRALVDGTDGLPLRAVTQVKQLADAHDGWGLEGLDEALRLFRLGVMDNPWKQPVLADRLRLEVAGTAGSQHVASEGAPSLRDRVMGQDRAVDKALDVLVRSVTGMRSAQSPSGRGKPRGVLFFAGPTGVGKTELAKSLAALLFGDEGAMVRFDMSEFAAEHAAERLVGAPPGYVGFSQGGELTNAVRERPFSLLLFDEIEKAHQSLLDRFLAILDDGRLTDGRGQTTYFTESVIVFTSNLGVYDTVRHPETGQPTGRVLAVDPGDGYEALVSSVTERVRDHFTSVVGRPELLNRIGDNIVVFDFIRPEVALSILNVMVANVVRTFRSEHRAELVLTETAWADLVTACTGEQALLMGGRGIGNQLESALIDPLARWTFDQRQMPARVLVESVRQHGGRYDLTVMGA